MLSREHIKKLGGKIITNKDNVYTEIKFNYNEDYTFSFLVKHIPIAIKDLGMVYIVKGRNKEYYFPILNKKIIPKEVEDKEVNKIVDYINTILNGN